MKAGGEGLQPIALQAVRSVDPEQAQIDIWGDNPDAVAASSLAPRAAAKRVAGGWRLSGRYTFSSGCDYAQWAIIGAF